MGSDRTLVPRVSHREKNVIRVHSVKNSITNTMAILKCAHMKKLDKSVRCSPIIQQKQPNKKSFK